MNFRGRKAVGSMASKAKTDARFELSRPSYLLDPVFEVEIGPIEAVLDRKSKCTSNQKTPTFAP